VLSDPNVAGKVDTEHHLTGHTSKWLKVTRRLGQRAFLGDAGKLRNERARLRGAKLHLFWKAGWPKLWSSGRLLGVCYAEARPRAIGFGRRQSTSALVNRSS
jgi:hypothetical protein